MTPEELPENSMMLMLQLKDEGDMSIMCGHNLSEELGEETIHHLQDMLTGLFLSFDNLIDLYALIGAMSRYADELRDELEGEGVSFEPDEELLKAIQDAKVIPFNKKKMH